MNVYYLNPQHGETMTENELRNQTEAKMKHARDNIRYQSIRSAALYDGMPANQIDECENMFGNDPEALTNRWREWRKIHGTGLHVVV